MSNWAMQLSAILLPKPVRNCSIELWVETYARVQVRGWVAGCKMRDPGCAGMLCGKVCRPVVLQVIADISSFMHLIADLHCL